jgi:hypothetical protein
MKTRKVWGNGSGFRRNDGSNRDANSRECYTMLLNPRRLGEGLGEGLRAELLQKCQGDFLEALHHRMRFGEQFGRM